MTPKFQYVIRGSFSNQLIGVLALIERLVKERGFDDEAVTER